MRIALILLPIVLLWSCKEGKSYLYKTYYDSNYSVDHVIETSKSILGKNDFKVEVHNTTLVAEVLYDNLVEELVHESFQVLGNEILSSLLGVRVESSDTSWLEKVNIVPKKT